MPQTSLHRSPVATPSKNTLWVPAWMLAGTAQPKPPPMNLRPDQASLMAPPPPPPADEAEAKQEPEPWLKGKSKHHRRHEQDE